MEIPLFIILTYILGDSDFKNVSSMSNTSWCISLGTLTFRKIHLYFFGYKMNYEKIILSLIKNFLKNSVFGTSPMYLVIAYITFSIFASKPFVELPIILIRINMISYGLMNVIKNNWLKMGMSNPSILNFFIYRPCFRNTLTNFHYSSDITIIRSILHI